MLYYTICLTEPNNYQFVLQIPYAYKNVIHSNCFENL